MQHALEHSTAVVYECLCLSFNSGLADGSHLVRCHGIGLLCADGEFEANHGFDLAQFGLVPGLDSGFHGSPLVVENSSVYRLNEGSFVEEEFAVLGP